jgi:multidrug efflux pump subunit AcrA (membrane-fusion protein)
MLVVVIVGGALVFVFRSIRANRLAEQSARIVVQDETIVETSDLSVTVSAVGTVSPARQVKLAFELSAPVLEIFVREGQPVAAGTVLARLDVPDLETALQNAQIALDLQQISYNTLLAPPREVDIEVARAAVTAAQASVSAAAQGANANQVEIARLQAEIARNRLWQQQLQRDQRLTPPEIPEAVPGVPQRLPPVASPQEIAQMESSLSQADYEVLIADANSEAAANRGPDVGSLSSANAQLISANAQLDRLLNGPSELDVRMAENDLQRAQLAVDQARANLSRAVLVAPFDGIIAKNNLVIGELPPQTAFELIDASSYYVDLAIDETDIVRIETDQPASLALDALPETRVQGTVTRVAQTPTLTGQVVTYLTRVTLAPTFEPIRVGMNATATIVVDDLQDVLTLRNRFIRIDRTTQQAFATIQRSDGQFEEVKIELGLRNETHSQVLSGLEAGQRVVLLPRESLIPGVSGR